MKAYSQQQFLKDQKQRHLLQAFMGLVVVLGISSLVGLGVHLSQASKQKAAIAQLPAVFQKKLDLPKTVNTPADAQKVQASLATIKQQIDAL